MPAEPRTAHLHAPLDEERLQGLGGEGRRVARLAVGGLLIGRLGEAGLPVVDHQRRQRADEALALVAGGPAGNPAHVLVAGVVADDAAPHLLQPRGDEGVGEIAVGLGDLLGVVEAGLEARAW